MRFKACRGRLGSRSAIPFHSSHLAVAMPDTTAWRERPVQCTGHALRSDPSGRPLPRTVRFAVVVRAQTSALNKLRTNGVVLVGRSCWYRLVSHSVGGPRYPVISTTRIDPRK